MVSCTSEPPASRPATRPAITNPPIAKNTVEGEWIPRTPQIASIMVLPINIIASYTSLTPFLRPFTRPSIMYCGRLSASFIPLNHPVIASLMLSNDFAKFWNESVFFKEPNHSLVASAAEVNKGTTTSSTPVMSKPASIQSRNFTNASPILAVRSRISMLK